MRTFNEQYQFFIDEINTALQETMQKIQYEEQKSVIEAMSYSLLSGGKRVRGVLALAFCEMLGQEYGQAMPFAMAVEMVHAYSLIHDDLPCMDDDDLRRGMPSCHVRFGEDIALLAGDGLLTLAFEMVSSAVEETNISAGAALDAVKVLSAYAGTKGMVGGQVIDLESEGKPISGDVLKKMHQLKTSALIQASCELGAIAAGNNPHDKENAAEYGYNLGMAFQILDDILDVTGEESQLGKPIGSDRKQEKSNYITLYGLEKSKEYALLYSEKAKEILQQYHAHQFLTDFTQMLLYRKK